MASIEPVILYSYRYGGLLVDSCVQIGLLTVADDELDADSLPRIKIEISDRPILSDGEFVYTWSGQQDLFLYKLPHAWVFRYSSGIEFGTDEDGSVITCYTGSDGWSPTVTEMLVRRILPRVIAIQDRNVVHAASLTTPYGGILLCGSSHAGKSTLATSLSQKFGWGLLDDDTSILTEHPEKDGQTWFRLHPVAARAGLWPDSVAALSDVIIHAELMSSTDGKYRCELPNELDVEGQKLSVVYRLDSYSGDNGKQDIKIESVSRPDATALLVKHRVRFYPSDAEAEMERFTSLARMAHGVPARAVSYPKVYDKLSDVCDSIHEDLRRLAHRLN
jgi:hypothetical protein